jgi:hypothetical protein
MNNIAGMCLRILISPHAVVQAGRMTHIVLRFIVMMLNTAIALPLMRNYKQMQIVCHMFCEAMA